MKKKLIISLGFVAFIAVCSQKEYVINNNQYMEENYENGYFYKRYESDFAEAKSNSSDDEFIANLTVQCDDYADRMYEDIFGENGINRGEIYSRGLSIDTTGFLVRSIVPNSGNAYYFTNENWSWAGGFYGQCVWYATGRAQEIIDTLGIDYDWTFANDAALFFNSEDASHFGKSTNPLEAKQGAILVFSSVKVAGKSKSHTHGHVMVVEKVNTDSEGKIISLDLSEGGKGFGFPYFNFATNQNINSIGVTGNARGWEGYNFVGYIYLDEPINLPMINESLVVKNQSEVLYEV